MSRPVGFGHSCGGAAILLAEEARPGTFARSTASNRLCSTTRPTGWQSAIRCPTRPGVGERRSLRRIDAFVNFSSKPPFADLDPEVLECYVESGFEIIPPDEGGDGQSIRLRCRRDDEAAIYARGADHGAFGHLSEVRCHVTLCCGEDTDAFGLSYLRADAEHLQSSTVEVVPGVGHFGPMQQPAVIAASVERACVADDGTAGS